MTLIRLENISLSFGQSTLLEQVNLTINQGDKIFLVGRNGQGKSCLFKVILGIIEPDRGKIHYQPNLKIATLAQELPHDSELTVFDFVSQGLAEVGVLLQRYQHLIQATEHTEQWFKELEQVQTALDAKDGWHYQNTIAEILEKLELIPEKKLCELSGGWQRRAALARALVVEPDLLLLDEPTNHLDLAGILWLEEFLANYGGALLCITHDRNMLNRLSTKIIELDRGQLTTFNGNFAYYLEKKQELLEVEQQHNKQFDKVLAREEAWIRQGVKARRTRNEGRVRALEKLRREHAARKELQGKPNFNISQYLSSGNLVINAEGVNFSFDEQKMVKDFTLKIFRGDKIALLGPNGVGKSTFLKLLLQELTPTSGSVTHGTRLEIAYFDQLRQGLDLELSALDNVAGGREFITVDGQAKHIIGYLGDFLFSPERARVPVKMLSGGECNRVLLAKLFSNPNNFLILDEPTNDLDIESLELLEEILMNYPGTILLVSHDRSFIDNIATSTLCFRGNGIIEEYIGGYKEVPQLMRPNKPTPKPVAETKPAQSFDNNLNKELLELPKLISKLEQEQTKLTQEVAQVEFYNQDKDYINRTLTRLGKLEQELTQKYQRWEELELLKSQT